MTKKDFNNYIKMFPEKNRILSITEMLKDLIEEIEADWDYPDIRYSTVMSEKKWEQFSKHPERTPYKSKLKLPNSIQERNEISFQIFKFSYAEYSKIKESSSKEDLRGVLSSLLTTALHVRYSTEEMRLGDSYVGRPAKDRDTGNVVTTDYVLNRIQFAIRLYSRNSGKNYKKLTEKLLEVTRGKIQLLSEAYFTCKLEKETRKDIHHILGILRRDKTLAWNELQLSLEILRLFKSIGLSLETYLKLQGFPSIPKTKKLLIQFLSNEEHKKEMEKHLKDEFPKTYSAYKKEKAIDKYLLLQEESEVKNFPTSLKTEEDIKKMIIRTEKEVYTYLPLANVTDPRTQILNPTHPYSTNRAFQSAIKNHSKKVVSTIVMTPRVSDPNDYLTTFAHETTHALHRRILDLGEKSGVLKQGASKLVTSPVMEIFSMLVDDLFANEEFLSYKKNFTSGKFPNFDSMYSLKFQAIFALIQIRYREKLETFLNDSEICLDEDIVRDLTVQTDKYLEKILNIGFKFKRGRWDSINLLASYSPDDGLRYIKSFITERKKTNNKSEKNVESPLPELFQNKYGKFWLKNKKARIVLHWLLLETGRNMDPESYSDCVANADIKSYSKELEKIGLNLEKI